ncbi:MAG: hypothetical protein AAFU64_14890 [Bacteroidota bacterium]
MPGHITSPCPHCGKITEAIVRVSFDTLDTLAPIDLDLGADDEFAKATCSHCQNTYEMWARIDRETEIVFNLIKMPKPLQDDITWYAGVTLERIYASNQYKVILKSWETSQEAAQAWKDKIQVEKANTLGQTSSFEAVRFIKGACQKLNGELIPEPDENKAYILYR